MYERQDSPQQWSVHAEFTISHPGADDIENPPKTNTIQDENGTRLLYSWTSKENTNNWSTVSRTNETPTSRSACNRCVYNDAGRPFMYQRGNLIFTSTPPRPFSEATTGLNRLGVQDSGYGSDLLSPSSLASSNLSKKPYFPNSRKCKSTCNIILSTDGQERTVPGDFLKPCHVQCGRTQSLRCQTPALRCRGDNYNFYGCGDPWCHHSHIGDDSSCMGQMSSALETCVNPHPAIVPASTFTGGPSGSILQKKDASVQTFENVDKSTSPSIQLEKFNKNPMPYTRNIEKDRRKNAHGLRHRNAQFKDSKTPSSFTPDSLDILQPSKKLSRSPNLKKLAALNQQDRKKSASDSSDPLKKPHTVHIDVYCTDTDIESDDTRSSDSSQNVSTPQTVFESNKICITHGRSENTHLPFHLRDDINVVKKSNIAPIEKDNSDDDEASTAYPSKISSYSTINDFSSSISSVPKSWTTYSLSSCIVPDDYDSVANTSWKDTFSDIDSLLHSSSSIVQGETIDFTKKSCKKSLSIDEAPEIEDLINQENNSVLHPSESFKYTDLEDRIRIKEMEEVWKSKSQPKQRYPQTEKKLLLQQKKMQEYIKKRLTQQNKSKDSDSDFSDDCEKGWTFIKFSEEKKEPGLRFQKSSEQIEKQNNEIKNLNKEQSNSQIGFTSIKSEEQSIEQSSCSHSTQSTIKSPNTIFSPQSLSCDNTLRSPFSVLPGQYTEQRRIASRFGPVVNTFRKPGHHIGPSKNPDCLCDHCQRYFNSLEYRNRTHSAL